MASVPRENAPDGFLEEVMSGLRRDGDKVYAEEQGQCISQDSLEKQNQQEIYIYIYIYILG